MSAATMISGGTQAPGPGPRRLRAVPEPPLADVRDLSTARSAMRRRRVVLADDPATQRRPLHVVEGAVRDSLSAAPDARPSSVRRVMAGVCAVVVATGIAAGAGVAARPDPYAGPTFTHSVAAGESVWSLAASLGSPRPLDQVVADIEDLNHLDRGLLIGEEISLPAH